MAFWVELFCKENELGLIIPLLFMFWDGPDELFPAAAAAAAGVAEELEENPNRN